MNMPATAGTSNRRTFTGLFYVEALRRVQLVNAVQGCPVVIRWEPMVAGAGEVVLSILATAVYLSAIDIDDGLEALMFLPILAVVSFSVGIATGSKGADAGWPAIAGISAGACTALVIAGIGLLTLNWLAATSTITVAVVVAALALAGGFVGWALGRGLRRVLA
jgi:hypothetical protein